MARGLVSFVVLNWNGLDDTLICLDSIRKQTVSNYEIVVVDNGSAAEQKAVLSTIPDITFVDLPVNTGFAGGQIAWFKQAKGDFLALINNDCVIAPDWTEQALACMQKHPDVAVLGGKAYQWKDAAKHAAYSEKNPFYSYQVVNLVSGHTRTLTYGDSELSVDSISGSAVMIRRRDIERVGYFDGSFFAYYEETDLFARFRRVGLKVLYSPKLKTWHKISQSTKSKPEFYLYYMHRNRFVFAVKNFDTKYLLLFMLFYAREWARALLKVLRYGRSRSIEEKNLVKAGLWNAVHLPLTFYRRSRTLQLGRTYSRALLSDKGENISIIIPCFNYADYVKLAIDSALAQTLPADEIIVINDGSTDNSLDVIRHYADRVTIVDQKNQGLVQTKNNGLGIAKSDWIVFLDADDTMQPTFLEELYRAGRRTNAHVVYSAMRFTGYEDGVFWSRPYTRRSLRKGNYINNSALMRRDMLLSIGGYKKEMAHGYEDWELYLSLAELGKKFRYVAKPLLFYRRHRDTSRDKAAQKGLRETKRLVKQLHPRLFSKRYMLIDFMWALLLFWVLRSPWQILKDMRYLFVSRLDKLSQYSRLLNKLLGFSRLLGSGNIKTIREKVSLNLRRLRRRA